MRWHLAPRGCAARGRRWLPRPWYRPRRGFPRRTCARLAAIGSSSAKSSPNTLTARSLRTPASSSLKRIWIGWVNRRRCLGRWPGTRNEALHVVLEIGGPATGPLARARGRCRTGRAASGRGAARPCRCRRKPEGDLRELPEASFDGTLHQGRLLEARARDGCRRPPSGRLRRGWETDSQPRRPKKAKPATTASTPPPATARRAPSAQRSAGV